MTTFLTVEEAAAMLRLKEATIRTYVRAGKLPAKKLLGGKQVLIEERDLLSLLGDASSEGQGAGEKLLPPRPGGLMPTARELRRMSPEERAPYLQASAAYAAPDGPAPYEYEDLETGEIWDYDDDGSMVAAHA